MLKYAGTKKNKFQCTKRHEERIALANHDIRFPLTSLSFCCVGVDFLGKNHGTVLEI